VSGQLAEIAGVRAWVCDAAGPALDERLATDIIGESLGAGVGLVVIRPRGCRPPSWI